MTRAEMEQKFPDHRYRTATITVTLWQDEVESDDSLRQAIETELSCCHCVDSIDKIEIT